MVKVKQLLIQKFQNNKVLFGLVFAALLTTGIGLYYNSVRDLKTTYNFAIRDTKDKVSRIFFQRASGVDEDKKIINEVFNYKYGTIVNLSTTKAYYISNQTNEGTDQVFEYNFSSKESSVVFNNELGGDIDDIFLNNNVFYYISDEKLYSFSLVSGTSSLMVERLNNVVMLNQNLPFAYEFNEFINLKDNKLVIGYDNCKFVKEKCKAEKPKQVLIYDLTSKDVSKVNYEEVPKELLEDKSFFGTNKVFRRGTVQKYEDDKGNTNYNLRYFTQF